jgi:hypothetical protein
MTLRQAFDIIYRTVSWWGQLIRVFAWLETAIVRPLLVIRGAGAADVFADLSSNVRRSVA